jgi:hypothetical protein
MSTYSKLNRADKVPCQTLSSSTLEMIWSLPQIGDVSTKTEEALNNLKNFKVKQRLRLRIQPPSTEVRGWQKIVDCCARLRMQAPFYDPQQQ